MVLSVDGYVSGPKGELDWEIQDPVVSMSLIPDLLKTVDSMIMGRVLYEGFSQAWPAMAKDPNSPKELVEFANWLIDSPKYVVSKTLQKAEWNNSFVLSVQNDEDIIREVTNLKASQGGDIVLFGGVSLAQTLVRLNLVDEYRFKVQPIVLGKGMPLFKDLEERNKLQLTYAKAFESSGVLGVYYTPAKIAK